MNMFLNELKLASLFLVNSFQDSFVMVSKYLCLTVSLYSRSSFMSTIVIAVSNMLS